MNETNNNAYLSADGNVMTGTLRTDPVTPSLRTAAAIAALQGILASPSIMASTTIAAQTEAAKQGIVLTNEELSELTINAMTQMAVRCADALLTELEKEKE